MTVDSPFSTRDRDPCAEEALDEAGRRTVRVAGLRPGCRDTEGAG